MVTQHINHFPCQPCIYLSAALDKAQRRLALLKGVDANLAIGNGFTIESYTRLIEQTRSHLEAHNTLLSEIDESRQVMAQPDATLDDVFTFGRSRLRPALRR